MLPGADYWEMSFEEDRDGRVVRFGGEWFTTLDPIAAAEAWWSLVPRPALGPWTETVDGWRAEVIDP